MGEFFHAQSPLGQKLRLAVIITALILAAEVVGGLLSNSLALLSDAGHVFTDFLALLLSWFGVLQAERPPSARMTFGYHRIGILIALVNALSIVGIAVYIFYEAYQRLRNPEPVQSVLMLTVAFLGLVANLFVLMRLRGEQHHNLNVKSALLHALGDALASLGVMVGGAVIFFTGSFRVDPAISILIALILLVPAWSIIRESINIFLEASPTFIDTGELVKAVNAVPGVKNIHDLHIWTLAPQMHALSCHVQIDEAYVDQRQAILEKLNDVLLTRFDIEHSTVQLECVACDPDTLYCTFNPNANSVAREPHVHSH